ncbi:hypothetical protein [Frigoriflavimonas asaccharolytica]|uniref:Uncharacterized protein n=1 Tax=Frigoriflavimonas asaccharolytica TaxID=2735899 RepID=A0A8J8K8T9_9FLAO|nr:hypothetical protein [Frigoriflavimonas asaccharolytica]NRS93228.1 hypothetical protein [Frigoriflavimonas asaccharolytica]
METQKNASSTIRPKKIKIVIAIQSKIDTINPPNPSPPSINGTSGAVPDLAKKNPILKSLYFGKSSHNFTPL